MESPKGSVLEPLSFLIYVNDISRCIPPEKLRLFADDTNVFISGNNFNDIIDEADETQNCMNGFHAIN